jgi:outer membrane biosynthesis protein TonB
MKFSPMIWVRLAAAVFATAVAGGAMTNGETARDLNLAKFVLPDYPGMLWLQGVPTGETPVAVSRGADGRPRDVLALETSRPEFARAALQSVAIWAYEPPVRGGRPVVAYEALTIQFGPAAKN